MSDVLQSTLKTKLDTVINNCLTGSTSATNVLNLALSVWSQNEANILVVDRVGNLPYLEYYTSPNSILCFISSLGVFAISSNMRWITLDGRLLRNDQNLLGIAYKWGTNTSGQMGDNTTIAKSSPVSIVGGFVDWCAISSSSHTVAVRSNGTTWAWGCNNCGQIGDNTTTNRSSPVSVVGGITDWCRVSTGINGTHTLAIRTNGSAWSWGNNVSGRLGDLTTTNRSSPVSVVGGFTDWCEINAAATHSVALRSNGTIWSWGQNQLGILGTSNTIFRSSPVSVVGGFTDWCRLSSTYCHTVASRVGGTAWAWGINTNGRLGDNTTTDKSSPVSVVGGFTDWSSVSAGQDASVGLRAPGAAWSWGTNSSGQLADNTTTNRSSPVSVVGGFTNWCSICVGSSSVGLRSSGQLWAWGPGSNGQLGDNSVTTKSSPVSVLGGFTDWCAVSISAGIRNIC